MSISSIVVETGANIPGANSYLSVADVIQYGKDRQYTFNTAVSVLIIKAMDYIEALSFKGVKLTRDQALQWPRYDVVVDGYYLDSDTIPLALKKGLAECVIAIDQGDDPLQNLPVRVQREKVDEFEVEYQPGAVQIEVNRKIKNVMWKLLDGGAGHNSVQMVKA